MTPDTIARFEKKIVRTSCGCWIWLGANNGWEDHRGGGHGQFCISGKKIYAHRAAYEHYVSKIPDGLVIDHLCRVPQCVNPDHMRAVTQAENVRSGEAGLHNPKKDTCKYGHQFDIIYPRQRQCSICKRDRKREWRASHREHVREKDKLYRERARLRRFGEAAEGG